MAQAAHAATAVLHENADSPQTKEYLAHLSSMRKTVMEVGQVLPVSFKLDTDCRYRMRQLYGI